MPTIERSNLHVEGINDVHVIKHLLHRHGINCPIKGENRPTNYFSPAAPKITAAGDKDAVLEAMGPAVRVSNGRSVAFVVGRRRRAAQSMARGLRQAQRMWTGAAEQDFERRFCG